MLQFVTCQFPMFVSYMLQFNSCQLRYLITMLVSSLQNANAQSSILSLSQLVLFSNDFKIAKMAKNLRKTSFVFFQTFGKVLVQCLVLEFSRTYLQQWYIFMHSRKDKPWEGATTLSTTALRITTLGIMAFNRTILGIMTPSITT